MAIGTPVSIGTVQNKTSETTTVLTTTAAVPAGALIVVAYAVDGSGTSGDPWEIESITDSAGNTYTHAVGSTTDLTDAGVASGIYYAANATALASGGTITLDWYSTRAPNAKSVSALYCEGIATSAALDRTGLSGGISATPSVSTSAATTQSDELTIGIVGTEGPSSDTFTQDDSPAYVGIPVRVGTSGAGSNSNVTLAGGYFIETATGIKTYNPTLGNSREWAAVIATFKGASAGNSYTGSGGAQSGGVAAPVLSVAPKASGGALASGIAALALGAVFLASGGATSGGAATVSMDRAYAYVAQGGAQSGGVAPLQVGVVPQASGGAQAGGVAPLQVGVVWLASGGAQSGGSAAVGSPTSYTYAAAGGAQSAGAAGLVAGRAVQASGGAQAGGVAPLQVGVVPQAAGGAQAGGVAPLQVGAVWLASGGAQSGGVAEVFFPATYVYVGDGGAVSGGSALALSGFTGQLLTVRLRDAAGAPQVGAAVLARRVRVGGAKYTVIDPTLSQAVTDGDGVAVLTLMPSLGDAYRVTATAGDGTPLLDVAVLVGPGDGELHSLPQVEGMQAWH